MNNLSRFQPEALRPFRPPTLRVRSVSSAALATNTLPAGTVPAAANDADESGSREQLIERLCDQRERLMAVAMALCHSTAHAEDLVQESMTRGLERLDSLRCEDRLAPWLKSILINLFRDQYRRPEPDGELDIDIPSRVVTPEYITERSEFFGHVRRAIQGLSPRLRQVVGLVCIADLSYADAAEVIDVPVGTVMSRLWRARKALHPLLDEHDIVPSESNPVAAQAAAWSWEGALPFSELGTACY